MSHPHRTPLETVIHHVTAQNRPGSHGAILVREIERLRAENAELRSRTIPTPTTDA